MHGLTIDVGDEVTLTKPRFTGWTTVLHMFLPARWMMMGGLRLPRAGKKSLLGEESLDDGLDD